MTGCIEKIIGEVFDSEKNRFDPVKLITSNNCQWEPQSLDVCLGIDKTSYFINSNDDIMRSIK